MSGPILVTLNWFLERDADVSFAAGGELQQLDSSSAERLSITSSVEAVACHAIAARRRVSAAQFQRLQATRLPLQKTEIARPRSAA